MNIVSAVLQLGALVLIVVLGIAFQRAEEQAKAERKVLEVDISDCPPFLPDDEKGRDEGGRK
ncbi:MAG: hypothetical protein F4Z31_00715 [Gemmatimonadetes bacterium]|nr:hypothetical protein [Gemmatimonadota bacterium]MYE92206.1 hypothetical protein [Gemmatimonadota bacterium]MYJ12669.1 hypothetical protein [Gemmatimonadota bacterium]